MRKLGWVLSLLLVMAMSAMAFAVVQEAKGATPAVTTPGDSLGLKGITKGIVAGAIVGLTVALLGFAKDKDPQKKFDLKAAAPTILLGIAVGGLFGWDQKDLVGFAQWRDAAATVLIGELGLKAGWRNVSPIIGNISSTILGRKNGSET